MKNSEKRVKGNRGITLIALVITIIILIILATISVNMIFSENGLIATSKEGKDAYEIEQMRERIETIKIAWETRKVLNPEIGLEDFWEALIQDNIISGEGNYEKAEGKDDTYIVSTNNGFTVEIIVSEDEKEITIGEIAKGKLLPKIEIKSKKITKNSITVKAEVQRLEDGYVKYYWKLSEGTTDYEEITNITEEGAVISGLTEGTKYDIKIEATNSNGTSKKVITETARDVVMVSNIVLDKIDIIVRLEGTSKLKVMQILPENAENKEVKWSSSNPEVATVDNGKISVKSVGTTTITVSTTDGSNKAATCKVKVPNKTEGWDSSKVNEVVSADNKIIPVPKGFTASKATGENTEKDGFVIYQGTDEVNDGNVEQAKNERNQFVWVPVLDPSSIFGTSKEGQALGKPNSDYDNQEYNGVMQYKVNYGEPTWARVAEDDRAGNKYKVAFIPMKESVEKYGGFYIGRYETGDLSTSKAVVKRGKKDIQNAYWHTVYNVSSDIINEESAKSQLIWGCQWRATMDWFKRQGGEKAEYITNNETKGNYTNTLIATGTNENYKMNNIYDLAGNAAERSAYNHDSGKMRYSVASGKSNLYACDYEYIDTSQGSYGGRATLYIP